MAVFLSPVAGAAAQFLDNSGNVLSGGKLYTYVSGTTTPLATFTNSTGITSHTNPIILDSAGRISNGGEIWLADNAIYKFVLKTSADTLIATWDALTGINSNFLNYQIQNEIQTATADQTIFTLTEVTYTPGTGTLSVFVDGVKQYDGSTYSYVETDSTTVTFTEGLHVGALVQFTTSVSLTAGATTADMVAYTPAGTGAVATDVQTKLRETVSVKDFGAVGDGVTDDTAAIQAAFDAGNRVLLNAGTYKITSQLTVGSSCCEVYGEGMYTTVLSKAFNGDLMSVTNSGVELHNFGISGDGATYTGGGVLPKGYNVCLRLLRITDTADSCVIFDPAVGTNAGTGTYCTVEDCFLLPTLSTTYSIRSTGADDPSRPTSRSFIGISGGGPGPDFSGMNLARLERSLVTSAKFDSNSQKIFIGNGNRFTLGSTLMTVFGVDHVIDGNFFATSIVNPTSPVLIDSTCTNVFFGPNNNLVNGSGFYVSVAQNQTLTPGLANPNTVYTKRQSNPTLPWLGSVSNPSIGNGSFFAYYEQNGSSCTFQIGITVGSTTNVGSGNYSFQLPFKAYSDAYGTAMIKSSGGVYYPATLVIIGGSSLAYVYLTGDVNGLFASTSVAVGSSASISLQGTFLISPN